MIGPISFSFFTLVHASIALLALTFVGELPAAALCLFIVEAVTAFDNGVTVVGNRMGIGQTAERINRLRFLFHAVCIGLLVPVYAGIGNAIAFSGEPALVIDTAAWVLAMIIGVYGYFFQYRSVGSLMPVSYFGCLRYAQSVSEATRLAGYDYTAEELAAKGKMPMASIYTTLVGLLLAIAIGWFGSFWVPCIVTALMFLAGSFPLRSWGPFATSCLEVIFSAGLLYSLSVAAAVLIAG